jgi:hypothetical protein
LARQTFEIGEATASQLGMTGRFLPFKDEGAKGNEQAYGLKEE